MPWDERAWDRDGLAWTRAAYAARRALPALRRGTFCVAGATDDALAFVREGDADHDQVLVAVNAGDRPVEVPVSVPQLGGATLRDVPLPDTGTGTTHVPVQPHGGAAVPVPPRTGRIMVRA
jgi:hypothetical protein